MRIRVMYEGPPGESGGPSSSLKLGAATDLPEGAEGTVMGLYGTTVVAAVIHVARSEPVGALAGRLRPGARGVNAAKKGGLRQLMRDAIPGRPNG